MTRFVSVESTQNTFAWGHPGFVSDTAHWVYRNG